MKNNDYISIIGLEVHVELKTKSKMFCGCSADHFGKEQNTQVCPICLGLPGALPVPNKKAIEWCVMIGLALNCKIPLFSRFDRKNYFYPDLPKGYQISQYEKPFCVNGSINIKCDPEVVSGFRDSDLRQNDNVKNKRIKIRRVHMEEDTAKLVHEFGGQKSIPDSIRDKSQNYEEYSLIDFNRSGIPLVEIVTEPDFESATAVVEYLKKLQQIVRYLEVSDADMEKGMMRLEPNVSLIHRASPSADGRVEKSRSSSRLGDALSGASLRSDSNLPSYKVEVKNINSFRFVEKAINYEIERQRQVLESGKTPVQETRGWDEKKQITVSQRTKEKAMDYRYFPEADIPPIRWAESQISNLKSQMPELPDKKYQRFQKEFGLSAYDSEILTREKEKADYFEEAVRLNNELKVKNQEHTETKIVANWIINKKVNIQKTLPAEVIRDIINKTKTESIDLKELESIANKVIANNPKAVSDYKKGKKNAIMFLVGQVVRNAVFRLDLKIVKEKIEKMLQ